MEGAFLMSRESDAFLAKAAECLAGAESEYGQARYNNTANRSYFACFHAAVAALSLAGVRSPAGKRAWTHAFVQGQFPGFLINRRKLYPTVFRRTLDDARGLREQADYQPDEITAREAARTLNQARAFVSAVTVRGGVS